MNMHDIPVAIPKNTFWLTHRIYSEKRKKKMIYLKFRAVKIIG